MSTTRLIDDIILCQCKWCRQTRTRWKMSSPNTYTYHVLPRRLHEAMLRRVAGMRHA